MKVNITDFGLDLNVKRRGLEMEVRTPNGAERLGDLHISNTGLTWSNGQQQNGTKVTWREFIEWMNS